MPPANPRPLGVSDDLAAYADRLVELLERCASHQSSDPATFLWNARRALEVICRMRILVVEPTSLPRESADTLGVDALFKKLDLKPVDAQIKNRLESVRSHTNLGVHIRRPEPEDFGMAVEDVGLQLPGLVDWLYQHSALGGIRRPDESLLEVIREGGHCPAPVTVVVDHEAELVRLGAELAEYRAARVRGDAERTRLGPALQAAEGEAARARGNYEEISKKLAITDAVLLRSTTDLTKVRAEHEAARGEVVALQSALERAKKELQLTRAALDRLRPGSAPAQLPARELPDAPRARRWGALRVTAGLGALLLVALIGLAATRMVPKVLRGEVSIQGVDLAYLASLSPTAAGANTPGPVTVPPPSPGGGRIGENPPATSTNAALTSVTTSAEGPDAVDTLGACPGSMARIAPVAGLLLGQPSPPRKRWPSPEGSLYPTPVPTFCIDRAPRKRGDYPPVPKVLGATSCLWNDRPNELLNCLTRDEAEQACAAMHAGSRLPTLLEWEAAARVAETAGIELPKHEWSGERFPSATLRLRAKGWSGGDGMWVRPLQGPPPAESAVHLSWNQQDPDIRHPERGLRCVLAPG